MAISDALANLCSSLPSVEMAAFVDMRSNTVLSSSTGIDLPQEKIDALCQTATRMLGGAEGDAQEAVALSQATCLAICRAPNDPSEAVCVMTAPDADVEALLTGARTVFEQG